MKTLSEEAVHLAPGMLAASGYRSVATNLNKLDPELSFLTWVPYVHFGLVW